MGTFTNALIKEVGKNTGKVASNMIFGDGWSTPHRRVRSKSTPRVSARALAIEAQQELEHNRMKYERDRIQNLKDNEKLTQCEQDYKHISTLEFTDMQHARSMLYDIYSSLELICLSKRNSRTRRILNKLEKAYFKKYIECVNMATPILTKEKIKECNSNIFRYKQRKVWRHVGLFIVLWWFYLLIKIIVVFVFNLLNKKVIDKTSAESPKRQNEVVTDVDVLESQTQVLNYDLIDLNKNLRIENRLSAIWNRYSREIGVQAKRRPLFICDSPANCILYVGINPSYNRSEDDFMIKSVDGKSLYYESLYQEEDAPQYFRLLEAFTRDVSQNLPYSHMNLLYAREDNREALLKMDHNFIREQLELSYESITMLKPKAIVFFSIYCKDLIFGADRWVDPASHSNKSDSYILNGTNIPVIFSEDVTLLDIVALSNLEQRLKTIAK